MHSLVVLIWTMLVTVVVSTTHMGHVHVSTHAVSSTSSAVNGARVRMSTHESGDPHAGHNHGPVASTRTMANISLITAVYHPIASSLTNPIECLTHPILVAMNQTAISITVPTKKQQQRPGGGVYQIHPVPPACSSRSVNVPKVVGVEELRIACPPYWVILTLVPTPFEGHYPIVASVMKDFEEESMCSWSYEAVLEPDIHEDIHATTSNSNTWERWVYALLACAISSLVSLAGVSMFAFGVAIESIVPELLGLSAGSLIGSVFFVLLPETGVMTTKMAATMFGGVIFSWIVETMTHGALGTQHGHAHAHGPSSDNGVELTSTMAVIDKQTDELPRESDECTSKQGSTIEEPIDAVVIHSEQSMEPHIHTPTQTQTEGETKQHTKSPQTQRHSPTTRDVHLAIINAVGDILHNFVDGVLIGVVFVGSNRLGWILAGTIALHEFPQELGDFALLLRAGLRIPTALVANFIVSLSAWLGAIVGIVAGEQFEHIEIYFIAFVAGVFLYLALAGIIPLLHTLHNHIQQQCRIWACFVTGIGIMALLLIPELGHSHGGGAEGGEGGHGHAHG